MLFQLCKEALRQKFTRCELLLILQHHCCRCCCCCCSVISSNLISTVVYIAVL